MFVHTLAYDHTFEDGNGRAARALFCWYVRTRGSWLVESLTVTQILAHAPAKSTRDCLRVAALGDDRRSRHIRA